MAETMDVGAFVRFNAPTGSYGKIIGKHPVVPDFFYVEWCYGLDKKGESIFSTSGGIRARELIHIAEDEYLAVATNPVNWSMSRSIPSPTESE